ncbi:TetR/AcrR family transcriptional regulator [Luteimonas huabeiensis]|uniref:TetR/AcrR family transcriptional regulator n=1 Tax=Luteimonas huabeiensis TaxID=1244513 RepID=UPI000463C296|nr:TetR/AcrR family transcriptional regulator [Luteimonas huabeiensis]
MTPPAAPDRARCAPRQARGRQTYERLLQAAGELLAEVGFQELSTNMICARAGLSPPALYRYMKDKYAVLEALAERLMADQNAVLEAWLGRHAAGGTARMARHVDELLRETAEVTRRQPGAVWILRSLRAIPQLSDLRRASNGYVTERLARAYAPSMPELPPERLRRRVLISVEFGYAIGESVLECAPEEAEPLLAEAARMLASLFVVDTLPD